MRGKPSIRQITSEFEEKGNSMFEQCIKCEHLGKDCSPNLFIMPMKEIREWAMQLKAYKHITNAELSERSGVPKGTIDMHFSKKHTYSADVNYSTFAPILCALIECDHVENQCPNFDHDDEYAEEQFQLVRELAKSRLKAIIVLATLLGLTLFLIILGLLVDRMNPNVGFFWLGTR